MSYRYSDVVDIIRKQIDAGTLRVGDRLPSIRQLSQLTGFSNVTIHRGYELLESLGFCEARPRSGFYLIRAPAQAGNFPIDERHVSAPLVVRDFPQTLMASWEKPDLRTFGAPHPSEELFDCTDLDQSLRRILRDQRSRFRGSPEGDENLRLQIAKRAAQRGILTRYQDVVLTGSAMQGFNLCLDAFTEPGDVILVESPSYFPTLAGIKRRNVKVIEIYSHPTNGLDPDQFEYLVRNNSIRIALLMVNNHYPTGVTYSDDTMQRIVASAQNNGVLILENDMLGELHYNRGASSSLKQFDRADTVLQFSSFENSLSSNYGIGWVLAGRHARELKAASHLGGYLTNDVRMQRAVADYLTERSQDRHQRNLREKLQQRMERGLELLADLLPPGCSVTRPNGGYMCWVRAPKKFVASGVLSDLHRAGVGILPGPVFSAAHSFENFFSLNFSFAWDQATEQRLGMIATAVKEALSTQIHDGPQD